MSNVNHLQQLLLFTAKYRHLQSIPSTSAEGSEVILPLEVHTSDTPQRLEGGPIKPSVTVGDRECLQTSINSRGNQIRRPNQNKLCWGEGKSYGLYEAIYLNPGDASASIRNHMLDGATADDPKPYSNQQVRTSRLETTLLKRIAPLPQPSSRHQTDHFCSFNFKDHVGALIRYLMKVAEPARRRDFEDHQWAV
ncbi:hypothetical protein B0H19DRAFT_1063123 [Mycena capillaripes]|nr:hypothetical protein B0H19DRAFT_1063123 [Mycena capillaripes]